MAKRRANGEGSIGKRKDGKWLVTFPTGLYKKNGKKEYLYFYFNSQAEAVEKMRKLQSEKAIGGDSSKAVITAAEWIENWIERRPNQSKKLATATLSSYRTNYRLHIKPFIGKIPLKDLSTYQIQRMLDSIGKSRSTFIKNYNIVHGALELAAKKKIIFRNPCDDIVFPDDEKKGMRVLTQEEQRRFISALNGEYYRVMLLSYLYTGMRMGEGIPLLWSDIDLERRTIRVNKKAIVRHDFEAHSAKQEVQDKCKTKSSKRIIVITSGLSSILAEHKEVMRNRAKQLGEEWSEDSLVFRNSRGNMVYSRNLQEVLYRILDKAGIEGATMHTLRHTYATRCFEAGVDIKAISEQLGHANVKTTYNIYVHLLEDTKAKEIDKLAGIDKFISSEPEAESAVVIPFPEKGKAV